MQESSQNADEVEKSASVYKTNKEKGDRAEKLFLEHLNNQDIPFLYIDQNYKLYSKKLLGNYISRPDYIAYTLNGDFYIDVKYRDKMNFSSKEDYRFWLFQNEIDRLFNFQAKYNLIVWVAFTNNLNIPDFYYAPILKIYEYSKFIINELKRRYPSVHKDKFKTCHIYILDSFLYDCISYDRGFHNKTDFDFPETDVEWHNFDIIY